jgi:hypothetical protein
MSDEPLPPPPDVLAYGEFTLSLRSALDGKWMVRIAHRGAMITSLSAKGREVAVRKAWRVCDSLAKAQERRRAVVTNSERARPAPATPEPPGPGTPPAGRPIIGSRHLDGPDLSAAAPRQVGSA